MAALECLFELGADLQLRDSGGARPLHDAAAAGDVPTVELLGTMRGEVDAVTNDGSTAALIAARAGMAESLRCLAVMCEANLRIPNRSGETVASIAAMHRHGAVLDVLSALGHNTGHVNRPAAISEPSSLMREGGAGRGATRHFATERWVNARSEQRKRSLDYLE